MNLGFSFPIRELEIRSDLCRAKTPGEKWPGGVGGVPSREGAGSHSHAHHPTSYLGCTPG